MKKFGKILLSVALVFAAMLILSSCGSSSGSSFISDEQRQEHILKLLGGSEDSVVKQTRYPMITSSEGKDLGITGMVKLTENSNYILYMDFNDTSIAV